MKQAITSVNYVDDNDNPTGGYVEAVGLHIRWQDGPLGRDENRQEPNGAIVETVLVAALERLTFYQESKFKCDTNARAITAILEALQALHERTRNREERNVEGTHAV